ncbi:hypothetical protein VCHA53O466_50483 [Vibrio chagasii]|nr:hypothetical protein VCHA53O466_50483 [Vibrio chagasii]
MKKNWAVDLSSYDPVDTGNDTSGFDCCAKFYMSFSGVIYLSDNRDAEEIVTLLSYSGYDELYLEGTYVWLKGDCKLILSPHLEMNAYNPSIREGLRSLIGVHNIQEGTPVISLCSRHTIFEL